MRAAPRLVLCLVGLLLLSGLLPGALAGTAEDPEVTDPAGDQSNAQAGFGRVDLVAAWVEAETAEAFVLALQLSADATAGSLGGATYAMHATFAGTEAVGEAVVAAEGVTPGGAATAAAQEGPLVTVTLPKSAFGAGGTVPGQPLTGLFATARATSLVGDQTLSEDRAPDAGNGRDYVVGSQADGVDTDGDGQSDRDELADGTDPTRADTDGDGLSDGDEVEAGTDPTRADTDGDGLSDGDEVEAGTDPARADTDGDGLADDEETRAGTDPTVADSDGDGLSDGAETQAGTDPRDPASGPAADDEGDGGLQDTLGAPDWLWFLLLGLAGLAALLLVAYLVVVVVTRRRGRTDEDDEGDEDPDEEGAEATEAGEAATGRRRPFRADEAYLREGLSEEEIEEARRRFEDRERRYRRYAGHPDEPAFESEAGRERP